MLLLLGTLYNVCDDMMYLSRLKITKWGMLWSLHTSQNIGYDMLLWWARSLFFCWINTVKVVIFGGSYFRAYTVHYLWDVFFTKIMKETINITAQISFYRIYIWSAKIRKKDRHVKKNTFTSSITFVIILDIFNILFQPNKSDTRQAMQA